MVIAVSYPLGQDSEGFSPRGRVAGSLAAYCALPIGHSCQDDKVISSIRCSLRQIIFGSMSHARIENRQTNRESVATGRCRHGHKLVDERVCQMMIVGKERGAMLPSRTSKEPWFTSGGGYPRC